MSIIKEDEFDYPDYTRTHLPDTKQIQRGIANRMARFEAATMKRVIRIDEDILEQFSQITSDASAHERLINDALREWLAARTLKALLQDEFQHIEQKILSSIQLSVLQPYSEKEKRI